MTVSKQKHRLCDFGRATELTILFRSPHNLGSTQVFQPAHSLRSDDSQTIRFAPIIANASSLESTLFDRHRYKAWRCAEPCCKLVCCGQEVRYQAFADRAGVYKRTDLRIVSPFDIIKHLPYLSLHVCPLSELKTHVSSTIQFKG